MILELKVKKATIFVIQSILNYKDPLIQEYMKIVQSSRYIDTVLTKFENID